MLLLDEFDRIYRAPDTVSDSILNVLRAIKQDSENFLLQVIIIDEPDPTRPNLTNLSGDGGSGHLLHTRTHKKKLFSLQRARVSADPFL